MENPNWIPVHDVLYDPNIFKKIIYPMYLELQREYWCHLNITYLRHWRVVGIAKYSERIFNNWFRHNVKDRVFMMQSIFINI